MKDKEEKNDKCEEYLNNWKREQADFINYKREEGERIKTIAEYIKEDITLKIIPILDNFYIAESHAPEELKDGQTSATAKVWTEGILRIKNQMLDLLKNYGVEEIEIKNNDFDPNTQEAIEIVEKQGVEPGKIIEEIKKGYKLNGKVIRPSHVKVSK